MVAVRTDHFLFWIFVRNKPGGVVYILYYKGCFVLLICTKGIALVFEEVE